MGLIVKIFQYKNRGALKALHSLYFWFDKSKAVELKARNNMCKNILLTVCALNRFASHFHAVKNTLWFHGLYI
ncbi:MAG: hypothetical protein ACOYIT_05735 [Christensenellales bacterium]|jgi:hypothetical protein